MLQILWTMLLFINPSVMFDLYAAVWWADPGWMPGAHQGHSVIALLSWAEERKYNKSLIGLDKGREK